MSDVLGMDRLIGLGMNTSYQNLFPYLNIEPVPAVSPFCRENFFYEVPDTVTATSYYQQLKTLKANGQRKDMEVAAATFISAPPPTTTKIGNAKDGSESATNPDALAYFISNPSQYPTALLPIVNAPINERSSLGDLQEFTTRHAQLMADIDAVGVPVWLSVMSLVIQIDYELAWMEDLSTLLRKINVLSLFYKREQKKLVTTDELVSIWWQASFLLPEDVFPLPSCIVARADAAKGQSDADKNNTVSVKGSSTAVEEVSAKGIRYGGRYYALGTLHILKYKLTGYIPGELQKVETVLKGEMRELRSRHLLTDEQQQKSAQSDQHSDDKEQRQVDKDLNTYAQQLLSERTQKATFNDYKTTYASTSPNATTTGGWTFDDNPAGGDQETHEDFIKKVLSDIKDKATREVNEARKTRLNIETENTATNRFFNKSDRNTNGFYYWLNKKYQVTSSDLKKRLMIEISFPVQSSELESLLEIQALLKVEEPKTFQQMGVDSYADISASVPATTGSDATDSDSTGVYYLDLGEEFDVPKLPAPPLASLNIAENMKSNQLASNLSLAIPKGYQVNSVDVLIYGDTSQTYQVSVANQNLSLSATGTTSKGTLDLSSDSALQGALPVAIAVTSSQGSQSTSPLSYVVNVQANLSCSTELLNQWKYAVYQDLLAGYHKQLEHYYEKIKAAEVWLEKHDTPVTRALIDNYIAKQSMFQLYEKAMLHTGGDRSYPNDELPFFQYFESALEWNNVYCKLFEDSSDKMDLDLQGITTSPLLAKLDNALYLKRFLVATRATVLLPVKENEVLRFLYFLDTGQIWHGLEPLTPVNQAALAIVSDYKKIPDPGRYREDTNTWTIVLPTAMVVLGEDDSLRDIGGHLDDY